jgi:tetratricopeptide (TPR) repeat protein
MLLSQGRPEHAEKELRAALVEDPNEATIHAILSICLCNQEKFDEATAEAKQAIGQSPDLDLAHYALSLVMYHRNRFAESRQAIEQAIAIDPYDADYHAHVAALEIQAGQWQKCLEAVEQGLESEPEHERCTNLRSIALTKLGRREEAASNMEAALELNPENAVTHANHGWSLLHERKPKEAMEHFREALRLEPNMEWARSGIVEAMKARNPIYRWLLAWFLWLGGLSPRVQIGLVLGIVIGQQVLVSLTKSIPALESVTPWIIFGYLALVWFTWVAPTLFNLVLRFDKFGRLALSDEERRNSTVVGIYVLIGIGWPIADAILFGFAGLWIFGVPFLLALIPLNGMFNCRATGPRWIMGGIVAVVTLMALAGLAMTWTGDPKGAARLVFQSGMLCLYSTWASMFLIGWNSPKKL